MAFCDALIDSEINGKWKQSRQNCPTICASDTLFCTSDTSTVSQPYEQGFWLVGFFAKFCENIMSKTNAYQIFKAIGWKDAALIMVCSLLAGHYLVVHQEPESTFELLRMAAYYPALLGSFCIAFIVASCIRLMSLYLDLHWPWMRNFKQRLLLQLLFCTLMMIVLAFALASGYFWFRGSNIFKTDYYRQDFWLVVTLICFFNVFLAAEYAFKALYIFMNPPGEDLGDIDEEEEQKEKVALKDLAWQNIAYIYHKNRINWKTDFTGYTQATYLTIDELLALLPKEYFFKLQKGFIIHISAIDFTKNASSRRLIIYFKVPFNKDLPKATVGLSETNCMTVAQRNVPFFKTWLANSGSS